jgi:predicted DNA-binding transcriptional regulator AlpA
MQEFPELAGLAEAATILGVSKQRVIELIGSDSQFPRPVAILACGRIYLRSAVEQYGRARNRRGGRPPKPRGPESL